jgi:hypothetical protein
MAGTATLNITSFSVSAAEFSGNFAFAMDPFQSYNLQALEAGAGPTQNFSADNWNLGLNHQVQTANTKATGNTVNFTDAATQLTTAGFNLSAQATAAHSPPALPNYANASALQSGTFVLFDETGARTGGTITFDLFYDMSVSTPGSTATTYSQTVLNVLRSSDAADTTSFTDGLLSNNLTGGAGPTSGHFSWTPRWLRTGRVLHARAARSRAPNFGRRRSEPETYALMLRLAGIGAVARRRRSEAEADTAPPDAACAGFVRHSRRPALAGRFHWRVSRRRGRIKRQPSNASRPPNGKRPRVSRPAGALARQFGYWQKVVRPIADLMPCTISFLNSAWPGEPEPSWNACTSWPSVVSHARPPS